MFLLAFSATCFGQDEFTLAKKGSKVPDFEFEKSPGIKANISGYEGKTVLITFFATWCGPCRQELPEIQKQIYQRYKDNPKFELLIFGREHSWKEITDFKKETKFDLPFFPDTERKIFAKFAGQNIPRNFLISKTGEIIYSSVGYEPAEFAKLKSAVEAQLK